MLARHKSELRRTLKELRACLSTDARATASQRIAELAASYGPIERAQRVALYAPIADEVDTTPLFERLRARGVKLALPKTDPGVGLLSFVEVASFDDLVPGTFGVREPRGAPIKLSAIDVVVVPGLGFDRQGGRLGYGAGYYDRTLAGYSGPTVGVCYTCQLVEALPCAVHDKRVDAVITEDGIVETSEEGA